MYTINRKPNLATKCVYVCVCDEVYTSMFNNIPSFSLFTLFSLCLSSSSLLFLSTLSPSPYHAFTLPLSRYSPSLPIPHTLSPSLTHSRMVKQTFSCLGVLIKGLPGAGETSTFDPGGGLTLRDWKMAVEMMKSSMRARDSPTHTLFPGNGGRGWGQWNGR